MAVPGNDWWNLRTKHGRDKIFATPEILWQAACEYFKWCNDNPLIEIDYKGKDVEQVTYPRVRAFTIKGLCLYLGVNTKYLYDFQDGIRDKDDEISRGFSEIIDNILAVIYKQKFEAAAAGLLKENIISRELGLANKTEVKNENPTQIIIERVIKDDANKP